MDVDKLSLPDKRVYLAKGNNKPPRHRPGQRFLKGPIPWEWLCKAGKQSGRALHVANALWHLSGLNKSPTVALSGKVLRELGVDRHAGYRGLRALERSGLVSVVRHRGRNPVVTIIKKD